METFHYKNQIGFSKNQKFRRVTPSTFKHRVKKNNSVLSTMIEISEQFCKVSTFHGVRHIMAWNEFNGRKNIKLTIIGRTIWGIGTLMSILFSLYMMAIIYNRYESTPTQTYIESHNYPIWLVPFPAISFCNNNKVYAPNTLKVAKKLTDLQYDEIQIKGFLSNLTSLVNWDYVEPIYIEMIDRLIDNGYSIDSLMMEVAQPCEKMIKYCSWMGNKTVCTSLFRLIRSSEGFCCSFNYRGSKKSFEINSTFTYKPVRYVLGVGSQTGLSVLLDVEDDQYIGQARTFKGVQIFIHYHDDYPKINMATAFAQLDTEVTIGLQPSIIVSSPEIRDMHLHQRVCLFEDERELKTVEKYSFESCMTECVIDAIYKICSCIPFYYPDYTEYQPFDDRKRTCSFVDGKCLRDNKYFFSSIQPPDRVSGLNTTYELGMHCDCYPSCSDTIYNFNILSARNRNSKRMPSFGIPAGTDLVNLTSVHIQYQDMSCIKYSRTPSVYWDSFLAAFGGILGLCLGGSLLSLVELVYYATFKFTCLFLSNKNDNKIRMVGQKNVVQKPSPYFW